MANYTKLKLSGSTDGRLIKVVAIATAGTLIHAGSATPGIKDEVWLYAVNSDTVDRKLTFEWGGVTAPDDLIEQTVKAESGLYLLVPGHILYGNATPLVVRAFCATANVVMIGGYVNQIV